MTNKTPHPHAELIAEWAKDTSKIPERLSPYDNSWLELAITFVIEDIKGRHNYRLKPEEPPKPVIVSSLTDDDVNEIMHSYPDGLYSSWDLLRSGILKEVANAAAQRAIEDLKFPNLRFFQLLEVDRVDAMECRAGIERYIDAVKKGEL